MKRLLCILTSAFFLTSCGDCIQAAKGVILDNETKQPIDQVAVRKEKTPKYIYKYKDYSNELGHFEYRGTSGGLFNCPDLELYFSKEGYKSINLTFKSRSENDTVYLERVR